jgi:hypothetical protein
MAARTSAVFFLTQHAFNPRTRYPDTLHTPRCTHAPPMELRINGALTEL